VSIGSISFQNFIGKYFTNYSTVVITAISQTVANKISSYKQANNQKSNIQLPYILLVIIQLAALSTLFDTDKTYCYYFDKNLMHG
jgi:hypothetical protein